ncbi:pol-like protein [Alternaria burnsii]|uniref:Pol-like protein n=1 Tax=Alternaria burnsii TaxID=1187904 RepID=A0A8H7AX35_9PLEO|nr:pol-like protein [Alternaria burnsii]KAF7670723.1 pol-like protein [Alternaria burnsii]
MGYAAAAGREVPLAGTYNAQSVKKPSAQTQREVIMNIRDPLTVQDLRTMNSSNLQIGNENIVNVKIVSSKQLKSGELSIKTASSKEVKALRQFADDWAHRIGSGTTVKVPTFGVLAHGTRTSTMDMSKLDEIRAQILQDNRPFIPRAGIRHIGWFTRDATTKTATTTTIEFTKPEDANKIIDEGLILQEPPVPDQKRRDSQGKDRVRDATALPPRFANSRTIRESTTVVLRKPGKGDYTAPKSYRPIALINTTGKTIDVVIARRLSYLAETYHVLPPTHMGGRKMRSTKHALHAVASLLLLDVSRAFVHVSHARLLHNLRKRRVDKKTVKWIAGFLSNRHTSIAIDGFQSTAYQINTGIPQGSPLSSILYLFYNADLIDKSDQAPDAMSTGYIDDVGILAWGQTTEQTCKTLGKTIEKAQR